MREQEIDQFAEVMENIYALYGKNFSAGVMELWWNALSRYSLSEVRIALSRHVQDPDSGQFLPKPSDVIRHLQGNTQTQALKAWSKVESAIRSIGPYQSVVFDDPAIHQVVSEMGGWVKLCEVSEEELPYRAREFEQRYRSYVGKPLSEFPRQLTGIAETHNSSHGHRIAAPVLIGNRESAMLVYQSGGRSVLSVTRMDGPAQAANVLAFDRKQIVNE